MTDNEKIAALTAALDGMKAERNWYRTAWLEEFRGREELRGRLDALKKSEDTTSAALAAVLTRNETLEQIKESQNNYIAMYRQELVGAAKERRFLEDAVRSFSVDEMNWNRERDRLKGDLEHAQNTVTRLIEERDSLQAWYQAVMEDAEEFGL